MSRYSTNKEAWEKLFEKYDIVNQINKDGYFKITAKQINEFREARLMTKFDNSDSIPRILGDNKLSILPITSNSYMIAKFEAYKKFEGYPKKIKQVDFLPYIESLDYANITSESLALNCAYTTKILEDFLEEEYLVPAVSGKMGSGNFNFDIKKIQEKGTINVTVQNSRIEIDGGYEGVNSLAIVEAKNAVSDDFLVRQLYYPYRLWSSKVKKKVRPVYVVYSNGIFTIYEYKFNNINEYSSIKLVKCKRYRIEETNISLEDIENLISNIKFFEKEPEIPFPQANNFERVINLCDMLKSSVKEKQEITENYEFDERQADYYTNAARYLGLIDRSMSKKNTWELTKIGKKILELNYRNKQIEFAKLILSHEVFYKAIESYINNLAVPSKTEIATYMKQSNLYGIGSQSTYYRRASTVKAWTEWIISLINK